MKYWLIFVALALIGYSHADSRRGGSEQEDYHYRGSLMNGVLNPRQSYAGTYVEIDISVTRGSSQSTVKFSNSKAKYYNHMKNVDDQTLRLPGTLKAISALDGTFTVYFDRDSGTVMEVPSNEPLYVTNMRRAIVSILRVPPYLGKMELVDISRNAFRQGLETTKTEQYEAFSRVEEVYAGRCNVSYTITPDYNGGRYPGVPGNVANTGTFYRMQRSIDFDTCSPASHFTKTSFGNFTRFPSSQMQNVHGRAVLGDYLLRERSTGQYDIKGLTQTGSHYVSPFGQDTGRLLTFTNQTLYLTALRNVSSLERPSGSTKPVTTWQYQFASPAAPRSSSKREYVIYQSKSDVLAPVYPEYAILGVAPKPDSAYVSSVESLLSQIAQYMMEPIGDHKKPYNGTTDGRMTELLYTVTKTVRALSKSSLDQLAAKYLGSNDHKTMLEGQSFVDCVASSGSSAGVTMLVEQANKGRIGKMRMAAAVAALVNNIMDPASISKLRDYVLQQSPETHPLTATSMILNFATLSKRACTVSQLRTYSVPHAYLGSKSCDDHFSPDLISKLESKFKATSAEFERLLYVQSIGNVGDRTAIPFLREVAIDPSRYSNKVRIGAIKALIHNFPQKDAHSEVMEVVLPIAESRTEQFEVRQAAFIGVMRGPANESIFQRFAMSTWREPSYQMRAIITSAFAGLAQSTQKHFERRANIARKYLPLIRPVLPSFSNSLYYEITKEITGYQVKVHRATGWLNRYVSPSQPRQELDAIRADFGGVRVPLLEITTLTQSSKLRSGQQSEPNTRDPSQRSIHQEIDNIAKSLNMEMMRSSSSGTHYYISGLNYQQLIEISSRTYSKVAAEVTEFLRKSANKPYNSEQVFHTSIYMNPVDIVAILPTPFGLPSTVEVAFPTSQVADMQYKVVSSDISSLGDFSRGSQLYLNMTVRGQSKSAFKGQTYTSTIVPYESLTCTAAYDTEKTLSIPGQMSAAVNVSFPFFTFRYDVSPDFTGERPLFYYRNKPFSAIQPLGPDSDITAVTNIIAPLANISYSYNTTYTVPYENTGLKARLAFQGDVQFPINQRNIMECLRYPEKMVTLLTTPTEHDFNFAYRLDISRSETKNISIATLADFGYLDTYSRSEALPTRRSALRQNPAQEAGQKVAEKLSKPLSPEVLSGMLSSGQLGDFLFSAGVNFTVPASRTRQYQLVLTGTNSTTSSSPRYEERVVATILKSGAPNKSDQTKTCAVTQIEEQKKRSPPGDKSVLYTTFDTSVYHGKECSSSERVASVKTYAYLNWDNVQKQHRLRASEEEPRQTDLIPSENRFDPAERSTYYPDAVYDKIDFDITWVSSMPDKFKNMSLRLQDMMLDQIYPHVSTNRLARNHPSNRAFINATRLLHTGTFDAWYHHPDLTAHIQRLPICSYFDWATPFLGNKVPYHHTVQPSLSFSPVEEAPNKQCIVNPQRVSTFDGVSFEKKSSSCLSVVTKVYHEQESFAVLAGDSASGYKVIVALPQQGSKITIEAPTKTIYVNGVKHEESRITLYDPQRREIGYIEKTANIIRVSVTNKLDVVIRGRELFVKLSEQYKGFTKGMCGDFNGEKVGDLKSPKNCYFLPRQGEQFAASWIAHPTQCSDRSVVHEIRQAREIENSNCRTTFSSNSKWEGQ